MKLYGKKFIRNSVHHAVKRRMETRTAIIWQLDFREKYALVKIQGTNNVIMAYFPQSFSEREYFLKPGNAVIIHTVGGNQQRWEILGSGTRIPTPLSGGGDPLPEPSALSNAIVDGFEVFYPSPAGMYIGITPGTIRVNGVEYDVAMQMDQPTLIMDEFPDMMFDTVGKVIDINPAPAYPNYRIDIIVIGTDLTMDYIAGTPAPENPVIPTTPANHFLVCTIIVSSKDTVVKSSMVNTEFYTPTPTYIEITPQIGESKIVIVNDPVKGPIPQVLPPNEFQVYIKDQYGVPLTKAYDIELVITSGTGKLRYDGTDATTITRRKTLNGFKFYYLREYFVVVGTPPNQTYQYLEESYPFIEVRIKNYDIYGLTSVILQDQYGTPIQN